ncbi:MAG: efflux RND transporter periplasmic adaptor subunit [Verrucomicrobiota bacterium]
MKAKKGKSIFKIVVTLGLCVGLLAVALAVVKIMHKTAPEVVKKPREISYPTVSVSKITREDVAVEVETQGTVMPRTETVLVAEVSGKIIKVSPSLETGAFFSKGDLLLTIDRRDYEMAVVQAEAELAAAEANLQSEQAQAEQAKKDWERLGEGEQPALSARIPQLREAQATLRSAWAILENAKTDLERTQVIAPYDGRVRAKNADIGQYVTSGTQLAEIFATDYAEVRLPLTEEQVALIDLPIGYRSEDKVKQSKVKLKADFGSKSQAWDARIVRSEGVVNTESRMFYAIARVDDPYNRHDNNSGKTALPVGLFVSAYIQGKTFSNVVKLPREALKDDDTLHLITDEDRLQIVDVDILYSGKNFVVVDGKMGGQWYSTTPLEIAVAEMQVTPKRSQESTSAKANMKVAQGKVGQMPAVEQTEAKTE